MVWTERPSEKRKMDQKKSTRKIIVDTTRQYSSSTTIHGISYLSSDKIPVLERLLWLFVVVLAIIFTTFQVCKLYKEWQDEPVITTLDTVALPIEEVEFPAVTICPQGSRKEIIDSVLFRQLKEYIADKRNNATRLTQEEMMEEVDNFINDVYPGAKTKPTMVARLMTSDKPKLTIQNEAVLQLEGECDPSSNEDILKVLNKQLQNDSCPDRFEMAQESSYCIHESTTRMTYYEATKYCNDLIASNPFYLESDDDFSPLTEKLHVKGNCFFLFLNIGMVVSNINMHEFFIQIKYDLGRLSILLLDVKYMALDGCSTNAIKRFKDNPPTYYYGNDKKAEIICCAMDGSSCSRKTNTGKCRSGDNDEYKVTWDEADTHCKNEGMRLCNSQEELDQCCGGGGACGYNDQLVWINVQVTGKLEKLLSKYLCYRHN